MSRRGWDERTGSRVIIFTIKVNQNSKDGRESLEMKRNDASLNMAKKG